jgi:hypothetical protein
MPSRQYHHYRGVDLYPADSDHRVQDVSRLGGMQIQAQRGGAVRV